MLLAFTSTSGSDLFLLKQIVLDIKWRNNDSILFKLVSFWPWLPGELLEGRQGQKSGESTWEIQKQGRETLKAPVIFLLLLGEINSKWQFPGAPGASATPKRSIPVWHLISLLFATYEVLEWLGLGLSHWLWQSTFQLMYTHTRCPADMQRFKVNLSYVKIPR